MTERKFKVWLDSGANIHSCYETECTLDDLGITEEEWDEATDREKEEYMREIAFQRSEWGFKEI